MWQLIHKNDIEGVKKWLTEEPDKARIRSGDGRGPLWWAYEYQGMRESAEMVNVLKQFGAREDELDGKGMKPSAMKNK